MHTPSISQEITREVAEKLTTNLYCFTRNHKRNGGTTDDEPVPSHALQSCLDVCHQPAEPEHARSGEDSEFVAAKHNANIIGCSFSGIFPSPFRAIIREIKARFRLHILYSYKAPCKLDGLQPVWDASCPFAEARGADVDAKDGCYK